MEYGVRPDVMFSLGVSFTTRSFEKKGGLKLRGVSVKHGQAFGPLNASFMSFSRFWRTQRRNMYYCWEFGSGLMMFNPNMNNDVLKDAKMYGGLELTKVPMLPLIYWKFDIGINLLKRRGA
jgi:hypothetical protein